LGLPDGVLGVAWPSIRHTFNLPVSQLGSLLVTSMTGYLLSSFFAGVAVARLGVGMLLVASSLLVVAGLTGYALAPQWWVMVAFALLVGLGGGAVDAGINAHAARRFSPRTVTLLHACYGVGATLGPLLMTAVITSGQSWRKGYAILAILLTAMGAAFMLTARLWDDTPQTTPGSELKATARIPADDLTILFALRHPPVLLNILIFFLYTGLEVTAGQWAFSLLTESRRLTPTAAGTWVGIYWASLTAGRVIFGLAAARARPHGILICVLLSAPASAALFWLGPPRGAALLGLAILGFSLAPIFPLLISLTPTQVGPRLAPHSIGFQVAAATLGAAALPSLFGVIARRAGLEVLGPFLLIAALALATLYALSQRKLLTSPAPDLRHSMSS
jgi:fucose permease